MPLREDVIRFQRYQRQFRFLHAHGITTATDLEAYREQAARHLEALTETRKPLYQERRRCKDPTEAAELSARITGATDKLRAIRKDLRMCKAIAETMPRMQENILAVDRINVEREVSRHRKPKARPLPNLDK